MPPKSIVFDTYWADLFWSTSGRVYAYKALADQELQALHYDSAFDRASLPRQFSSFPGRPTVLVTNPSARKSKAKCSYHTCQKHLPSGSLYCVASGYCVVSPEFLLLKFAQRLDFNEIPALIYEYCGTYAKDAATGIIYYDVNPATSVESIFHYISSFPQSHGIKKLRIALEYAHDHSASPMETATHMRFHLPFRRGGFQLPTSRMNEEIALNREAQRVYKHFHCRCDLFFPEIKLDVEYNGKDCHVNKRDDDAAREIALGIMGLQQRTVTSKQYYDYEAFAQITKHIAKQHGIYLRKECLLNNPTRARLFDDLQMYLFGNHRKDIWE